MRLHLAGALGALALLAGACGNQERLVSSTGRVRIEPAQVDFGRVALGSTAERVVTVHNLGRAALDVSDVRIGGLGQDMGVAPGRTVVPGGQSRRVRLRYTPAAEEMLERRLELDVSDPDDPTVGVRVTGQAMRPRVELSARRLDFGRIEVGAERELPLTLRNDFPIPVQVRLTQLGDAQFRALHGSVAVPAESSVDLEVTFAPERLGDAAGQLRLLPCPTCAEAVVDMTGTGIDRALVVEPEPVDFRTVPIDGRGLRTVTLRNASSLPLTIEAVDDVPGGADEAGFTIDPPARPVTLGENETVAFAAHFAATRLGPAADSFEVRTSSVVEPAREVQMLGVGGGPEIRVDPTLAFGRVPVGARAYAMLRISNVGATQPALDMPGTPGDPGFEIAAGAPRFGLAAPAGVVSVAAGDSWELKVWYEPAAEGEDQGVLRIRSNDGSAQPWVEVRLVGRAYTAGTCTAEVRPERIDFGTRDPGQGAALGYRITNTGTEPCILRDIDLAPGTDPAFMLPGGPIESYVLPPLSSGSQMVSFDPARVGAGTGAYEGELVIHVVNAAPPEIRVPLAARSGHGCLLADPGYADFGLRRVDCGSQEETIRYLNTCVGPVDVAGVRLDDLSREGAFRVVNAPATPMQVQPGGTFDVTVRWTPPQDGLDFVALMVDESGRDGPLSVPMYAEAQTGGATTDRFVQHAPGVMDVLLVVDNSGSMLEEQQRAADAAGALIAEAQARGIDYHVAVTTTGLEPAFVDPQCPGGADGGEAGRFFPVDGSRSRMVTAATPDGATVLRDNLHVGLCHHLEQGMEAMKLALSRPLVTSADDPRTPEAQDGNAGFLRDEAALAVVFIGEEDDRSGALVSSYRDFLRQLKGVGGARVSAIVDVDRSCTDASGVATRYLELVKDTGGVARSICQGDFSGAFRDVAGRAFAPRTGFALSRRPAGAITVTVDGAAVPQAAFWYDAATGEVRFRNDPPVGSRVEVSYQAACP